jgi:hypothetical protein
MLQRQLSHLIRRKLDRRQVQASYIFCVWLRLVLFCEYVHSHDFCMTSTCCLHAFVVIIVYIRQFESRVRRTFFCSGCKLTRQASASIFQEGKARVFADIISALWRISSSWGVVRLGPIRMSASTWLIVPAPDDEWWWVWSNRWNNWQGKLNNSEKTCPAPLCPPQILHYLTWARTRAAAVGSRD